MLWYAGQHNAVNLKAAVYESLESAMRAGIFQSSDRPLALTLTRSECIDHLLYTSTPELAFCLNRTKETRARVYQDDRSCLLLYQLTSG